MQNIQIVRIKRCILAASDVNSKISESTPGKLASFEVTLKTVSKKMKKIELLRINVIFVHWI